jgi:hypothetical protein
MSDMAIYQQQSEATRHSVFRIIFPMFTRIWLLLLLVSGASAQQAPNLRVQSNVVLVPALVKDAEGHVVYGLTQDDFVIEDDGVEQAVHLDEFAESEPASVVVAVQTGRRAWREYSRMRGIGPMLTGSMSVMSILRHLIVHGRLALPRSAMLLMTGRCLWIVTVFSRFCLRLCWWESDQRRIREQVDKNPGQSSSTKRCTLVDESLG